MKNKLRSIFIGIFTAFGLFFSSLVYAIACPVCTIAVVGGTVLAREYGIDDAITGLWIGAVTLIACEWTIIWIESLLKKKNKKLKQTAKKVFSFIIYALFYFLTIIPLYSVNVIGIKNNLIFGIDKILFGIIVGSIIFFLAEKLHEEIKENNNNKSFFPFQRVVIPVGSLVVFSILIYMLTKI